MTPAAKQRKETNRPSPAERPSHTIEHYILHIRLAYPYNCTARLCHGHYEVRYANSLNIVNTELSLTIPAANAQQSKKEACQLLQLRELLMVTALSP